MHFGAVLTTVSVRKIGAGRLIFALLTASFSKLQLLPHQFGKQTTMLLNIQYFTLFTGATGFTGYIGNIGATGYQGPSGLPGVAGQYGYPGLQGGTGFTGYQGQSGPQGNPGGLGPSGMHNCRKISNISIAQKTEHENCVEQNFVDIKSLTLSFHMTVSDQCIYVNVCETDETDTSTFRHRFFID